MTKNDSVSTQTIAESLASVVDNEEGLRPEKAAEIKSRLDTLVNEIDQDENVNNHSVDVANSEHKEYHTKLKAGEFGEEEAEPFRNPNPAETRIDDPDAPEVSV